MTQDIVLDVRAFNRASLLSLAAVALVLYGASWFLLQGQSRLMSMIIATAVLAIVLAHMAFGRLKVHGEDVRVGVGIFRTRVQRSDILSVSPDPGAVLGTRLFGVGLPGFSLGWFTGSGGRKVFALVNDPRRIVRIKLAGGSDILVSLENAKTFERAIDRAA